MADSSADFILTGMPDYSAILTVRQLADVLAFPDESLQTAK
jgi:hypothetical protein